MKKTSLFHFPFYIPQYLQTTHPHVHMHFLNTGGGYESERRIYWYESDFHVMKIK